MILLDRGLQRGKLVILGLPPSEVEGDMVWARLAALLGSATDPMFIWCPEPRRDRRRGQSSMPERIDRVTPWAGTLFVSSRWADVPSAEELLRETGGEPVRLVLVDHLQLIRGSAAECCDEQVTNVARRLKRLAVDLDATVLCLAATTKDDPHMLRDAGRAAEIADRVLTLRDLAPLEPRFDQ